MSLFNASFTTIILRFYLLMAVVIISVLSGNILLSIFALPIFLTALLGPSFRKRKIDKKQIDTASSFTPALS
ncbi:MAG: hypothetical protein KTR24_13550 [Saprospiraceae bacterium]|nr:hypothetical protein [Saprospiraceae bacterium]